MKVRYAVEFASASSASGRATYKFGLLNVNVIVVGVSVVDVMVFI